MNPPFSRASETSCLRQLEHEPVFRKRLIDCAAIVRCDSLPTVNRHWAPQERGGTQGCGNPGISITTRETRIFGSQISMAAFARMLSVAVARPVMDKTGFTGIFDADVSFLSDQVTSGLPNPGPGFVQVPDPNAVTIFTALQEQLGLQLASDRGPVDVLLIDSVERPSEN